MLYIWFSIYAAVQKTITNEEIALISYVIFVVLTIAIVFVSFFIIFQRRKNRLLLDKIKQQQMFDEELIKAQQEIQEETLKHIGRELHDNVGQRLVLASMQMTAASKVVSDIAKSKVNNASESLKDTLNEVRALSKSLNNDIIFNLGFETTLKNEVERLNKSGLIQSSLIITGDNVNFENKKDELILFRILQEFSSNTLKYAQAENLKIAVNYLEDKLEISIENDGVGFDINTVGKGSGIINMEKRAEIINADFQLESQLEKGTTLRLVYPYRTN